MAKQVKQFRYYSDGSALNYPSGLLKSTLSTGEAFGYYTPIYKLGIQTMPGVKFEVNGNSTPIIVGHTGIFEMELNERTELISLKFNASSLKIIENNINAYLIVDIMYEEENV